MRIAIDASRTTVQRVTGTENYAIQLIRALIRLNTEHSITLYFRDQPPPDLFPVSELVQQRVIPFPRAWTHFRFAAQLWRDRPDITFVPAHTLPINFPGRAAVTIHDLGYQYFPQAHSNTQRWYLDWSTRHSAHRANVILADSHATADDLTKFYGTPADKIRVVYPGLDTFSTNTADVRKKYALPERYFLFIGTLQPRKNIQRIIQAYRQWKTEHSTDEAGLVLAGGKGWLFDESWLEGVEGVHLTGYIDEADKGALYTGALALVFPSSLPELVGDAGVLVDPLDVEAIARAMSWMTDNEVIRQTLRVKGYQQALKFTWGAAARAALDALLSV
jgi:glycosyltransferase involved in cell wall biosynthesis